MKVTIGLFLMINALESVASSALLLTPYIKQNRIEDARRDSSVDPTLFLNLTSYSGFLTIDERYGSNTFFWYFPVANKPVDKTPWIVWLQGGPGATSLAGLFDEMGPFQYDRSMMKIIPRKWSWAKQYSIVYIDNPVGAGFSYTNSQEGFVRNMDTCGSHLYNALRQFLMIFPELREAPLYIAGESYAGRYLPAFGLKILQQDKSIGPLDVNMQGIIMGNPVLNRDSISNYITVYQNWGLIDTQGALAIKPLQDSYIEAIKKENSTEAYNLRNKLLDSLTDLTLQSQMFNILKDDFVEQLKDFRLFIERGDVRNAIHVGSLTFTFSNHSAHEKLMTDFVGDVSSNVMTLLEHYKILIYCGQLDMSAPCVQNAQARRRHWHWSYREHFMKAPRTPWWYNNTIAGYVKSGGHFTEVLVRGAGHLVPMDKPEEMFNLISYFIRGIDLPLPPNYIASSQFTPDYEEQGTSAEDTPTTVNGGFIISLLLNVVLLVGIVVGVWYGLRWKRRIEAYLYNPVDETSVTDGVLSMA